MEKELYNRLVKVADKANYPEVYPTELLNLTVDTMEAIRVYIAYGHPARFKDCPILEQAMEIIKDYR